MSTDGQKYINLNEIPPNINGLMNYERSTPHHTLVNWHSALSHMRYQSVSLQQHSSFHSGV